MLKKLLTGCLTIVAAAALAVPAMADANVTGRVRTYLGQQSNTVAGESAGSVMEFQSDSRIQINATGEAGSFTGTAKLELEMGSNDGGSIGKAESAADPSVRQAWVKLANDSFSVKLGRDNPFGTYYLPKYSEFVVPTNTFWIGENVNNNRNDYLVVGLQNIGPGALEIIFGMNTYGMADTSADNKYSEQTVAAKWKGAFGAVGVQFEYASQSQAVDTGDASIYAGTKGNAHDGNSLSLLSFVVSYDISDMMGVGLNVESKSETAGTSGAEAATRTVYELFFNMGLDDTSGISVGYGQGTSKANPDADDNVETQLNLSYAKTMGLVKVVGGYYSDTTKLGDADANNTSLIALGLVASF